MKNVISLAGPRVILILLLPVLVLTSLPAKPAASAPAQQDDSSSVVFLPLTLSDAARSDLEPGVPLPSATPAEPTASVTAPPPTASPTPTLGPTAIPEPPIEIEGDWVRTPHYELLSPSTSIDKRDLGLMMEQFYTQATGYFEAEPEGVGTGEGESRLVGKIFADNASYLAGLRADGIGADLGGSGGYYDPGGKIFYLFVQPSRHYTRMLTMHEAAHQLQHLAGGCRNPGWWTEGEADHLGMHTWDGKTLHMKLQPLISLEDHPESALEAFSSKGRDIGYITRGERGWSYREAWGVVSFLNDKLPTEAKALRGRYCGGESSAEGWAAVFGGPVTAEINESYEVWLSSNQQPWDWVWNSFEPLGHDGFHGQAGSNAIAVMKVRPEALTVEIEPVSGNLRAGLMVAYHDSSDFVMLRLYADRRLEVIRVNPGWSWAWLVSITAPEPDAGTLDRMGARIEDGKLVVTVNGSEVVVLDDPKDVAGSFGLNLEGCEILVRVLP